LFFNVSLYIINIISFFFWTIQNNLNEKLPKAFQCQFPDPNFLYFFLLLNLFLCETKMKLFPPRRLSFPVSSIGHLLKQSRLPSFLLSFVLSFVPSFPSTGEKKRKEKNFPTNTVQRGWEGVGTTHACKVNLQHQLPS
jgi:hypothetical protein